MREALEFIRVELRELQRVENERVLTFAQSAIARDGAVAPHRRAQ